MSQKNPFAPYASPAELSRGRRKTVLMLILTVAAVVLAVVARRVVGDDRLVLTYAAAGVIWFVAAMAEAVRWSSTGEFEPAE